jgi:hypothetical protein
MKIYRRVTISIRTGDLVDEDSYEYEGPISECKGGSTTTNTQDRAYNARMAAISERQQEMAEEYYQYYKDTYQPYETAQINANTELLPTITAQSKAEAEAATTSATAMNQFTTAMLNNGTFDTQADAALNKASAANQAYTTAMNGLYDPNQEASLARADVANSYSGIESALQRDLGRSGVDPTSGAYSSAMAGLSRERAKDTASAMTTARKTAKEGNFGALTTAAQLSYA